MEKGKNTALKNNVTTKKKVKVCGIEKYINAATGEIVEMQVNEIEERDFNFHKIWMKNFVSTLELVGNKKTHVAFWIIDNLDRENRLIATVREIANKTESSVFTVSATMKVLQEADFLRCIHSGAYMVNPNIVFRGTHQSRLAILNEYFSSDYKKPELTKQEKIAMLRDSIAELTKQLYEIESEDISTVEVDPQLSFDKDGNIYQEAKDVKKQ